MDSPQITPEKLYVTDLDGTLLRGDQTVSPFTVKTLNTLIDQGLKITYATARSYHTASQILRAINFNLPCITHNGAELISTADGRILTANVLDAAIAQNIMDTGVEMGLTPFVCGNNDDGAEKLLYCMPLNPAQNDFIQLKLANNDPRLCEVPTPVALKEMIVLHYLHKKQALQPLKDYITAKYGHTVEAKLMTDIYFPGYYGLEVYHAKATKGAMLKELCHRLDVKPENVVVFGDQLNDMEMFAFAGYGIAVANAHDELKANAHKIIDSNENDGVAQYLRAQFY